jgi:hypothetical protein
MRRNDPIYLEPPQKPWWYKAARIVALLAVLGLVVAVAVVEPWKTENKDEIRMSVGDCMVTAWQIQGATAWNYCCFQEYDGTTPFLLCKMQGLNHEESTSTPSYRKQPQIKKI